MKFFRRFFKTLFLSVFLIFIYSSFFKQSYIYAAELFCGSSEEQINTAIGCIDINNTQGLVESILKWGLGMVGGIGIILIIVGGYQIMTSSGNPQKLNSGKDLITAALMGIVLLLFGVYILKLIGVDILNLPGFT